LATLIVVGGTLVVAGIVSSQSLLTFFTDGLLAAAILAGATGAGTVGLRLVGLNNVEPRWRLLLAAGLGVGLVSLLMLTLGSLGLLQRWLWVAILSAGGAAGILQLVRYTRPDARRHDSGIQVNGAPDAAAAGTPGRLVWLWLLVVPFAATAILASSVPAGLLWPEEGNGYDVLEYHLGAPREYFEAGRIGYLPHNIYSNFPFNVEMLYLLSMVLHGDPVAAVFTAQFINFWLGVLAVAAIWLAGREISPAGGILAGVAAATCPMLTFLSGIAYVENGMVFFTALALAATIRLARANHADCLKWCAAAGLFAGLACGSKYTAIPMVAAPLLLSISMLSWRGDRRAVAGPIVYVTCALFTFAPWMIKNVVHTGNPLFPLARSVFHEREGLWTDADAERWQHGHRLAEVDRPWWPRLKRIWREFLKSDRYGLAIGYGAIFGSLLAVWLPFRGAAEAAHRDMPDDDPRKARMAEFPHTGWDTLAAIGPMALIGIVVWIFGTHMAGRFAVSTVPAAAVMVGTVAQRPLRFPTGVLALLACLFATTCAVGTFLHASKAGVYLKSPVGRDLLPIASGADPTFTDDPVAQLNALTAQGHRVLLIGEARRFYLDPGMDYCVIFSRNPFAEAAAQRDAAGLLDWLREHEYDHVYVNWDELERFRQTYGLWHGLEDVPGLFARLEAAGLRRVQDFLTPKSRKRLSTLYSIRPSTATRPAS